MSAEMDVIYNEYIAEEKLKQGTKYERLAAIVFKTLNQRNIVINDLILRGDGKKTGHQIDVVVQNRDSNVSKRILIECKDYNSKVDLSIVRDFFGAITQIKPDEAFVVTTKGYTKGARTFAEDEGIKLAVLREFKEPDWEGKIRTLNIKMTVTSLNKPTLSWVLADNQEGSPLENLQTCLKPILNSLPVNPESTTTGYYEFDTIKYVEFLDILIGVKGFNYEFTSNESVIETIIDEGDKIALLVFKVLEGELDQIIFDQDLDKWTFNDKGEVINKDLF